MERVHRAIIVAAGVGNRLRPVTLETPKPLVKVNGKRMIDTQIEALHQNGIHEIYIVTGYKEDVFRKTFAESPGIHIISNPYYAQGNNITSLYAAREYLSGSFVLEGDLIVKNKDILSPTIEKSGYLATWMEPAPEWALEVTNGRITDLRINGGSNAYRLWGISMWTEKDGALLSRLVREQIEDKKEWGIYWDELALSIYPDLFDLGVRETDGSSLLEIDSLAELAATDTSYRSYLSLMPAASQ